MPHGRIDNLDPELLERLRQSVGLSKDTLAVKTGVTPNVISRWFSGKSSPAPPRALLLANALKVDVLDLTGKTMNTADIVDLRQRMGWTTAEVAEQSGGRISKQQMYIVEKGHPVPSEDKLDLLAELYGVSVSQVRRSWVNRRIHRHGVDSLALLTDVDREILSPWAG